MTHETTPPGTVAVERPVALGGGFDPIPVLWWFPSDVPAVGVAWLQHGYARKPRHLGSVAADLVARGLVVAMPSVESFRRKASINDAAYLDAIGDAVAGLGADGGPLAAAAAQAGVDVAPEAAARVVLVAHSAGCAVVARAASRAVAAGGPPAGVVLLDATDNLAKSFVPSLGALDGCEVRGVFAQPSWCNRKGQGLQALRAARTGYLGVQLTSGTHCDAEGDNSDRVCRTMCGRPDPANVAVLREVTAAWTHDLALGRPTPEWEPGGERLEDETRVGRVEALYGVAGAGGASG